MRPWLILMILLTQFGSLQNAASATASIELGETLMPGGMMIGKVPAGSKVEIDGLAIRVNDDGRFIFGAGRDAEGGIEVVINSPDGQRLERRVAILDRDYDIQRINGLPTRKVDPNKDDQAKIETDWVLLNETKALDSAEIGFAEQALWPVTGPISGVFGSQRILNGKPKSPHRGVDVAANTGTPVKAMLGGVVTVAQKDMYYTGGTVMVDHGHGLQSLYAHLSKVSVEIGERLQQGEVLGKIGATGRVTGPHLHLSLYWFKTALDPALLLGPMPTSQ